MRSIYPERRIELKTIDDDYTCIDMVWYGSVFKQLKRRHSLPHQPVVKGSQILQNWMIPEHRTFRKRDTIGSSFKSSFSRAATSMEYTRKTPLTSAV